MVGTPALSEPEEEVDFEVDTADEARDARQKPAGKRWAAQVVRAAKHIPLPNVPICKAGRWT